MFVPVALIVLGLLALLSNLGILGLGGWDWSLLWRFWPLLLIALGADLLFGRRHRGATSTAALALVAVAALGSLWFGWHTVLPVQAAARHPVSQPLEDARSLEVTLRPGIGQLTLGALASPDMLIEGSVETGPNERLEEELRVERGTAIVRLESRSSGPNLPFGRNAAQNWTLRLNPNVPTDLRIEAGIGGADLDLDELRLNRLTFESGIGTSVVSLPRSGRLEAHIRSGIGSLTVRLPREMAARVRVSKGLGAVTVTDALERRGDLYVSPDYDRAQARIDLAVDAGIGSVVIESF